MIPDIVVVRISFWGMSFSKNSPVAAEWFIGELMKAPKTDQLALWEQFLGNEISTTDLEYVVEHAPEPYSGLAHTMWARATANLGRGYGRVEIRVPDVYPNDVLELTELVGVCVQ